jgi:hypothetical protein
LPRFGILKWIARKPSACVCVINAKSGESQPYLRGLEHFREPEVRFQIACQSSSAAKRIVRVPGTHVAAGVGELADRTQMVARVEVIARIGAGFQFHSLIEKPLRHCASAIAFLTEHIVAPDKAAE